jgi:superfamily II DNA or RNA helicase
MSSKFITNQEKLLTETISNILPSSDKLYFLVGYFYFSGFFELYKELEDKELKILVGLEIERELGNKVREINLIEQESNSRRESNEEIREKYYESLVCLINETDFLDTPEKEEAFRLFISKIKDGTLEIKKTRESNHAKLYIFENKKEHSQSGEFPGTIITGSSNLTLSGLKNRFEINVLLRDKDDYDSSILLFNELWDKSVPIVDQKSLDDFMVKVDEKIWIDKLPRPYLVYIRILHELFSVPDKKIKLPIEITKKSKNNFWDLEYQKDAIKKGLDIISKHNGAIIADVVGLGKSIIASTIAHNLNLQTVVICPPHLKGSWKDYIRDFNFKADVYGSSSVHKALKDYENIDRKLLVIVDEAHKYRNELTEDSKRLSKLCAGNKVLLLTATPFNNKPQDIFSMIKLFQIPAKSTIRTVSNLSNRFKELNADYKKLNKISDKNKRKKEIAEIANRIRDILFPLVVRRSRIDLDKISRYKNDLIKQGIEFSDVQSPELLKYPLGELESKYVSTLNKIIKGFKGTRYKPTNEIKPDKIDHYEKEFSNLFKEKSLLNVSQRNLAAFMKRLLVHRFESSSYAFKSSIENMLNSMYLVKNWYEKIGKVPISKKGNIVEVDDIIDDTSDNDASLKSIDEKLNILKTDKGYYYIDAKDLKEKFINDLKSDIKLLEDIKADWFTDNNDIKNDPKIIKLKLFLEDKIKENPNRKIIIFTSYSDTADYVYERINNDFRSFKYTSKQSSQSNKEIIRNNFDAGINFEEQEDNFDVLIATDAISEGYNLHRAGIVINFDVPYNPTRVIQRVGRINRINKKVFDNLYIYNFFPSIIGEKVTKVKSISTLKLDVMNALLGNDTKILTTEEKLDSFYKDQYDEAKQIDDQESWETKYLQILSEVDKDILDQSLSVIPLKTKIRRTVGKDSKGVLVFAKKGADYIFKIGNKELDIESLDRLQSLLLLEADKNEKSEKVSENFNQIYQEIKSNLFRTIEKTKLDRSDGETINKLTLLLEMFPNEKEYLDDLDYAVENLQALSDGYLKYIRNINLDDKKIEIIGDLKNEISGAYLRKIINTANSVDEGEECLIVAEELV